MHPESPEIARKQQKSWIFLPVNIRVIKINHYILAVLQRFEASN